jgi:hypothetical protein
MKPVEAADIAKKWGDKPCDHPSFNEESGVRYRSGDYYCTQCGTCFPYSEYKDLIRSRGEKR